MKIDLSVEEREVIGGVKYQPAVSIILPFEPKMSLKTELEYSLKRAMTKVESELMGNYPPEKAIPVINRLKDLIKQLNFNTYKKSIALFVSPLVEKVFYLDIPVEEKIVIDDSFEIRDLVYSKKQSNQYLILLLGGHRTKMYLGNSSHVLQLILSEYETFKQYENDVNERVANFSDPDKRKEIIIEKYLHHIDTTLSLILQSYPLPVFVLGTKRILGHFHKLTKNEKSIVHFVHGNYEETTPVELQEVLEPYVFNWKLVRQNHLLHQIENARNDMKLSSGIRDVWKSVESKNSRLLVVEKDFIYPARHGSEPDIIFPEDVISNNKFYIKDAVDDIIEKVLENGGDVEFVDNDVLKDYDKIALIRYY
jgi:Bacterial archaeo-eukaryotic release factor family 3